MDKSVAKNVIKPKKILIFVGCLLVVGGLVTGIFGYKAAANEENVQAYREYSVSKGDITVGISESGTISLEKTYVSLPVIAEIEEVYVKVGSEVKEGDKIAKLNVDDIESIKEEYKLKLEEARIDLESAKTEAESDKITAKQTYDNTLTESVNAESNYDIAIIQLEDSIENAQKELADIKEELSELEEMQKTISEDYDMLAEYEDEMEKLNAEYDSYYDVYSEYEKVLDEYESEKESVKRKYDNYMDEISDKYNEVKTAKETYEKTESAYDEAKIEYEEAQNNLVLVSSDDESEYKSATEAYNSAKKAYESALKAYQEADEAYTDMYKSLNITYSRNIEKYETQLDEIEDKINDQKDVMEKYNKTVVECNERVTEFKEEYEEFKTEYNEKYENYTPETLAEKIEELTSDVADKELEVQKLVLGKDGDILDAQQQLENTVQSGETAETVYNQTLSRIDADLRSKQEEYDKTLEEYEEFEENIGDGMYIYADCDGSVAEVNVEAGDTLMSNQTMVAISNADEAYVSVSVSEDDISSLSVGQECEVTLSAYEGASVKAEIDTIAVEPSRSSGSVTYTVTVKIEASDNIKIYSGMTAEVTFIQKHTDNVLYVNSNAVEYKGNGRSVVLVYDENGEVTEKEVITGFSDGRSVEIRDGLSAGDKVLAESAVKLS